MSENTNPCDSDQIVCQLLNSNLIDSTWCCPNNKKCGENSDECHVIMNNLRFPYIIIIFSILIFALFFYRCVLICLSCRNVQNENVSNINNYRSVLIINSSSSPNPMSEESPPTYEQVINNTLLYRFEDPR